MTLLQALSREPAFQVRPVDASDHDFLRELYRSVRERELSATGWAPAQQSAFAAQQFECQQRHYHQHFADAEFLLLLCSGQRIGRLYWNVGREYATLVDIGLLPAWRARGLGSIILRRLTEHADRLGRDVELHVESANPARALYRRHGFQEVSDDGIYLKMRRSSARNADAGFAASVPRTSVGQRSSDPRSNPLTGSATVQSRREK